MENIQEIVQHGRFPVLTWSLSLALTRVG